MTPHPLATWVQLSVSPQRHAAMRRRRRIAARLLLAPGAGETSTPRLPAQRRPHPGETVG